MIDYKIFGLSPDAKEVEVEAAYTALKRKYRKAMLSSGEEGAEAARSLEKLNAEYSAFSEQKNAPKVFDAHSGKIEGSKLSSFIAAEELIKSDKTEEAQAILDGITDRDAEWHFIQALVYYKKSWFLECKKQLELAMQLDPNNKKYKDNYMSLLAFAEIMQQKVLIEEQEKQAKGGQDCCKSNNGACTAACLSDCCFKDEEQ